MQRVFEIEANWDQREKLRNFALTRSPVVPPYQIQAPVYDPENKIVMEPPKKGKKGFAFQEINDKHEISSKFLKKVKEKLGSRMQELEKEVTETMNEINTLKKQKNDNKNYMIDKIIDIIDGKQPIIKKDKIRNVFKTNIGFESKE